MDAQLRQVIADKITEVAEIAIDIFFQFIQPLLGLIISRHLSHQSERVQAVHLMYLQSMVDPCKEFLIGHEDISAKQTGYIECLAGGGTDTEIRIIDSNGCKGSVCMSGERELAVDLIA